MIDLSNVTVTISCEENPNYMPSQQRAKKPHNVKQGIAAGIRWAVWGRDNFTCQQCGKRSHLAVDHILAESKGGATEMDNLQTLCKSCNSRKGSK